MLPEIFRSVLLLNDSQCFCSMFLDVSVQFFSMFLSMLLFNLLFSASAQCFYRPSAQILFIHRLPLHIPLVSPGAA